jgi:hypothetical protein
MTTDLQPILEARYGEYLDLLRSLVAINTVYDNSPGPRSWRFWSCFWLPGER